MIDFVVIAVVVLIIAGISYYIYKEKKSGSACIGCPHGKKCSGSSGNGGCSCHDAGKP